MDDFNLWWYLIAAVIYFLTRGRKKKQPNKAPRPGTENTPPVESRPKSFEELLREITEGPQEAEEEQVKEEPQVIPSNREPQKPRTIQQEQNRRAFADDESKRVYEESIKMAEGADLEFAPEEPFRTGRLFKDKNEEEEKSFAQELMDGFDADEAKKAVIYSEIFNRKY